MERIKEINKRTKIDIKTELERYRSKLIILLNSLESNETNIFDVAIVIESLLDGLDNIKNKM